MIHVPDVAAAAQWYVSVGFTLDDMHVDCGETLWAHLTFGESTLMLNAGGVPSDAKRREVDLYIHVDDVDAAFGAVAPIAELVAPIYDAPYGMREFIVRDLNRFWLTFGQPIAPSQPEQAGTRVTLEPRNMGDTGSATPG